jgi:hypothetical protein
VAPDSVSARQADAEGTAYTVSGKKASVVDVVVVCLWLVVVWLLFTCLAVMLHALTRWFVFAVFCEPMQTWGACTEVFLTVVCALSVSGIGRGR